jgi:hypothetical protein
VHFKVWENGFEDGSEMLAKGVVTSIGITCTIIATNARKMVKLHNETTINLYLCDMLEFSSLTSF